jgi:hypothetical protein
MKEVVRCALLVATAVGLMAGGALASGVIMEKVLKDGTKVQTQDNKLYMLDANGKRTPAKDGMYTLQDGVCLKVQGGGGRYLPCNFKPTPRTKAAAPEATKPNP